MTRSKVVFTFLILMVWRRKGDRQKVWMSVDNGVLPCMF